MLHFLLFDIALKLFFIKDATPNIKVFINITLSEYYYFFSWLKEKLYQLFSINSVYLESFFIPKAPTLIVCIFFSFFYN